MHHSIKSIKSGHISTFEKISQVWHVLIRRTLTPTLFWPPCFPASILSFLFKSLSKSSTTPSSLVCLSLINGARDKPKTMYVWGHRPWILKFIELHICWPGFKCFNAVLSCRRCPSSTQKYAWDHIFRIIWHPATYLIMRKSTQICQKRLKVEIWVDWIDLIAWCISGI